MCRLVVFVVSTVGEAVAELNIVTIQSRGRTIQLTQSLSFIIVNVPPPVNKHRKRARQNHPTGTPA